MQRSVRTFRSRRTRVLPRSNIRHVPISLPTVDPKACGKAIPDEILDEPLAPLATPVKLTEAKFGKVDKAYIHTAIDQVISPSYQAQMVASTPVRVEYTLQTGHTPFLTDPDGVASDIEKAAK